MAAHPVLFIDSMLWGNGQGQKITVWIRKVKGCGHGDQATFDVGRRYMSVSLVPATGVECYYD